MTNVIEAVNSFLEKYSIKDKPLCLGFSGGYDSMCLLHVLYTLGCDVVAVHLNHNWRGEESKAEELNCENFAKKLGINFYSETLPDSVPHKETAAREARYDFFARCMKKVGAVAFLTAHNANDNAETVIYRIIKGTGVDGLAAISPKRDYFYRPLLGVKRDDIEKYCLENSLNPNIDSSNTNTKYMRNLIRHEIFPLFRKINPDVVDAINSLSSLAREDCEIFDVDNMESTKEFVKLPKPIQGRIIKNLLIKSGIDYHRKRIEELIEFVKDNEYSKSGARCSLGSGVWFFVNRDKFNVVNDVPKNMESVHIDHEGEYNFGEYVFSIKKCESVPEHFPDDSENIAYVNFDSLNDFDFTLRTRRDGDFIYPFGGVGKQKFKKYLNEKKVPFYKKDDCVLLCQGQNILWAAGLGISDSVKVDGRVSHRLQLKERVYR